MKNIINITVIHSEDNWEITIEKQASVAAIILGAARLLASTEITLPEDMRADFRATFLEVLNEQRKEAMEEIENC